jgi:hypothetical protein
MKLLASLVGVAATLTAAMGLPADDATGVLRSGAASDARRSSPVPRVHASAPHPFARAPRRRRAIVWAVGDGADGKKPAKALARRIARGRPDRFLYLGDVYERGTYSEFLEHYHTVYGRFAKKTSPTPGNHDWPRHRTGYDRYWKRITGRRPPHYYSFSLAGWQILSLNSEGPHGPGSAQVRWLERKVQGPGTCRLAFWHTPRYSAGTVHRDQKHIAPLWDALRGRAVLVVNGHEHDLQRLKPIGGITELIAGAGGHRHYPVNHDDPRLAFADDRHWGALKLVLRPGRANFAFIDTRGRRLDSGRVSCETG